jgi:hypothetical protein
MVSKKFGDLLVEVELEDSEMYRRGTIRVHFELGAAYETYYVSPPDVKKFRYDDPSPKFIDLMRVTSWIRDYVDGSPSDEIDQMVRDLIKQEITFGADGQVINDPFHNPTDELNPRHTYD